MFLKKENKTQDTFWQEYEEKIGEKVLSRGLGKYISGWAEFDEKKSSGIWGLIISTSGGFRFHHFPQHSWIDSLTSFVKTNAPKEKTIFIPKEKIVSSEVIKESKWWKRLLGSSVPHLVIRYLDETPPQTESVEIVTEEKRLIFEVEFGTDSF